MDARLRRAGMLALAVAVAGLVAAFAGSAARSADRVDLPLTHQHFNNVDPLATSPDGSSGESQYVNPPSPICATSGPNTDCEGNAPHNETTIAVNPTNTSNLIGSANDYQLNLNSGGQLVETAFSRAHVSFDGGRTWAMYPINYSAYSFTGDPGIAFDATGRAYLSTLGFRVSQGLATPTFVVPDVVVAASTDGGKTWSSPTRVASGTGSANSVGIFNDKPMITAWGNGNAIVTWTEFIDGIGGSYGGSPIFDSVTRDGGQTWSAPQEISGSAPFCIGFGGTTACDEDQGSTPVVAADGSIYVSFISQADNGPNFRDQYLVVKVDPSTGAPAAGPSRVANLVDGVFDYPVNVDGRQTYQDSEFRTWSLGNVAADPTNAQHLAVVWSDMRNSQLPAPSDPYTAKTNSDIGVSQSFNGGKTWSVPTAILAPGDQFMPWASYDTSGRLRIGYFDRSYDSANHEYGYTLATETKAGSLSFKTQQLTTVLSDPTQGDRWFSGRTPNPAFPHPTTFLGDYSGIAASPAGGVSALWTDMRLNTCFPSRCGSSEDAFYGTAR
jgi:hypothetical protein